MKKSLIVPALALTMVGTVLFTSQTFAQTTDPQNTLIEKLASTFNLNKDEVKKVFDEERTARQAERQADMQKRFEDRLTQLVTDGKITEDQKTVILEKHKELQADRQANMEKMKSMTQDERKAAMDAQKTELEQWASDNGLDLESLGISLLGFGGGMHGPHGQGMRGGK